VIKRTSLRTVTFERQRRARHSKADAGPRHMERQAFLRSFERIN